MHKQSYITQVLPLFLYLLSMSCGIGATNFKIKDDSVRGSHELGSLKVLHHDKKGYTVFAGGVKHKIQPHQLSSELRSINNKQLSALTKAAYISVAKQSDGELSLKSHVRGNGGMMGDNRGRPVMMMGRYTMPVVKGPAGDLIGEVGGKGIYWGVKTGLYALCGWAAYRMVGNGTEPIKVDNTIIAPPPAEGIINQSIEKGGPAGFVAGGVRYIVETAAPLAVGAQVATIAVPAKLMSDAMNNPAVMEVLKSRAADFNAATITCPEMGKTIQMAETATRNFFTTAPAVTAQTIQNGINTGVNIAHKAKEFHAKAGNLKTIAAVGGTGVIAGGVHQAVNGCLGSEGRQQVSDIYNQFTTQAANTLDKYALPTGTALMGAGATLGTTAPGCGAAALEAYATQQGITLATQFPTVVQSTPAVVETAKTVVTKGVPAAASGLNWAIEGTAKGAEWAWKAAWKLFPY